MKKVLPNIINEDQTGFIKGRTIRENINLIDNIIQYNDNNKMSGLLLFVDFEKAFGSLEWSFIEKALHFHGFGPSLVAWFRVFYSNTESYVINNGWSSNFSSNSKEVCGKGAPNHLICFSYVRRS